MSKTREVTGWFSRPVLGALVIGVLVLVLQVPIGLIRGLIAEREQARDEALEEVTAVWGGAQSVLGPRLVVPYRRSPGEDPERVETGYLSVLPAELSVEGRVTARPLRRGLHSIPVYEAGLTLSGRFETVTPDAPGAEGAELQWDGAALVLEVSEPRSVGAGSGASWDGRPVELLPGATGAAPGRAGVHARVTRPGDDGVAFAVSLDVQGAQSLWFVPFSRSTTVALSSNWPHPSFSGAWLPGERSVDDGGFTASWRVPHLGRDFGQSWTTRNDPYDQVLRSRFGVELLSSVDHYRMAERSTKYAALFLTLTLGLLWLFDTLVGVRLHPVQYLLVGAAVCTFYLLELSLAEHIGLGAAYSLAALAVVGLVSGYAKAVLRSTVRGALMAGATGGLYAYLFALLTLERYALLVGSVGIFAALATVMYLTRWVDWHRVGAADDGATA